MTATLRFAARAAAALCAAAALVLLYSFLPLSAPSRFTSPDENANRFFAFLFAEHGALWYADPMVVQTGGLAHPRSTRVVDDMIVPGGFLGLPVLYGLAAKALGTGVIPYLTPVVAALGVFAWGLLLRSRFGTAAGVAGAFLLALHPAWWYASSRTLYPNVLFCALLLGAAWLFAAAPIRAALERRALGGLHLLRRADAALAGILFGLSFAVRPAEAYWLLLGGAALLLAYRRALPWGRLAVAAAFAVLALAPFLLLNQTVYGSVLATGYGTGVDVPAGEPTGGLGNRLLGPLRPWLFPLGFAPRTALANAQAYGLGFFWWWTGLVAAALFAFFRTKKGRPLSADARAFLAVGIVVAGWLTLFYGSWVVRDNPDPNAVTIGSSYLRYWLPAFVLSVLPVAWAAGRLWAARPRLRALLLACAAAYALASGLTVFRAEGEGLLAVRAELHEYDAVARRVFALTPESNALIITDRADKYLFPARRVMVPLRAESTYAALKPFSRFATLYYFGITLPEGDLAHLREVRLAPQGLDIRAVETIGPETLYRFVPLQP